MLSFLRKLRRENVKSSRYVSYALGEIVLVVIGILIALSINNWNEERKNKSEVNLLKLALINDLENDMNMLMQKVAWLDSSLEATTTLFNKIHAPATNLDSIKQYAFIDFKPDFDAAHSFNNNTIKSIESTGKIELFAPELKNLILDHYQIQATNLWDRNLDIYQSILMTYGEQFSLNLSEGIESTYIGRHLTAIKDERLFVHRFNSVVGYKIYMMKAQVDGYTRIVASAESLTETLSQ